MAMVAALAVSMSSEKSEVSCTRLLDSIGSCSARMPDYATPRKAMGGGRNSGFADHRPWPSAGGAGACLAGPSARSGKWDSVRVETGMRAPLFGSCERVARDRNSTKTMFGSVEASLLIWSKGRSVA